MSSERLQNWTLSEILEREDLALDAVLAAKLGVDERIARMVVSRAVKGLADSGHLR